MRTISEDEARRIAGNFGRKLGLAQFEVDWVVFREQQDDDETPQGPVWIVCLGFLEDCEVTNITHAFIHVNSETGEPRILHGM